MSRRWSIAPGQPLLADLLVKRLGISPLLAQCLLNRGILEPEPAALFLEPRLKQLADPFLLPDMAAAIDRLWQARQQQESVVIFGDYDVDGVTSTALLVEVLQRLGWNVGYHLPQRLEEGYGLSREGIERCFERGPATLLLAVDCGSTAVATIRWLAERGTDVIVLDHHQVASPAPAAKALVNPSLLDRAAADGGGSGAPYRHLCSVGLAFKLAHALVKRAREQNLDAAHQFDLRPLLDLVALGTIADMVPLSGENRILVAAGLARIRDTQRVGLQALKTIAQITGPVGVHAVGFQLAPRLNAAGRLEDAQAALRLLLTEEVGVATSLAQELDARNRERQAIERAITDEVIGAVKARFKPEEDFVIVEGQLLWHIGVVGIVASRVVRKFNRPTIIIGGDGESWRGSGRSIDGFDLAAALRECDDLLIRHGGHAMAAGVTIRSDQVDLFRRRLNGLARRRLTPEHLTPSLTLDATVSLGEISLDRIEELEKLEPGGQGNPLVQLVAKGLRCERLPQRMGREQQHVKFRVCDGTAAHEAIWWSAGEQPLPTGTFDLAFVPKINEYNGRRLVQLVVLDWRAA